MPPAFKSASINSWRLPRSTKSSPCLCCSIPVGTRFPSSASSVPRAPASITPDGSKVRGDNALQDASQYPRLEAYVKGIVGAFANDRRILAWDIWNEPDNLNNLSYSKMEPRNKADLVLHLLPRAFEWARAARPVQPLTSGLWKGNWSKPDKLEPMAKVQAEYSDVISFHSYSVPKEFEKRVNRLETYHRPLLCTEYMARGVGSTFEGTLPLAKKFHIAAYNWGFVAGKTQTYLPWDSWKQPYTDREPAIWFHEVFRQDGTPYKREETALIRSLTAH